MTLCYRHAERRHTEYVLNVLGLFMLIVFIAILSVMTWSIAFLLLC
jgi:hypothetical protein